MSSGTLKRRLEGGYRVKRVNVVRVVSDLWSRRQVQRYNPHVFLQPNLARVPYGYLFQLKILMITTSSIV
jgi:hypothetical protein